MISEKQTAKSDPAHFIPGYKKFLAWQKANELVHLIYKVTRSYPKDELFGITSQMRRAALSVPVNIVEGYSRSNGNEFHHFLSISLGSLAEVDYFIEFLLDEGLLDKNQYETIKLLKDEVGRLVWKLYKSQE